jgi:hypothetical protein
VRDPNESKEEKGARKAAVKQVRGALVRVVLMMTRNQERKAARERKKQSRVEQRQKSITQQNARAHAGPQTAIPLN